VNRGAGQRMGGPREVKWLELLGTQVIRLPRAAGPSGRRLKHLLGGVALVVCAALLASWVHVQSITVRYRYSQAYEVQQQRVQIRDALEIERQMLRRPQRITRIAEKDLGMVLPEVEDRVILK
jgi:cell division protein FtsL